MKALLHTKLTIILLSMVGVSSTLAPASANLTVQTIQSSLKSTAAVAVQGSTSSTVKETTNTTVGNLAGNSSDSQVKVTTVKPQDIKIPSNIQPQEIIKQQGDAEIQGEINESGITNSVTIDKKVDVNNTVAVDICLDAKTSVGSSGNSSLANCNNKNQAQPVSEPTTLTGTINQATSVPEPTTLTGIVVLGGYLVYRRYKLRKSS